MASPFSVPPGRIADEGGSTLDSHGREDRLEAMWLEARRVQSSGARLVALVKLFQEGERPRATLDPEPTPEELRSAET